MGIRVKRSIPVRAGTHGYAFAARRLGLVTDRKKSPAGHEAGSIAQPYFDALAGFTQRLDLLGHHNKAPMDMAAGVSQHIFQVGPIKPAWHESP